MKSNNTDKHMQVSSQQSLIEKEYINSMLNISTDDMLIPAERSDSEELYHHSEQNDSDIECKVFRMSGLNLALPIMNIAGTLNRQIIETDCETSTGNKLSLGKIHYHDDVIEIIDLTCLIMNGLKDDTYQKKINEYPVDVLLLKAASVGIVYEKEIDTQTISEEQVCWRNSSSDRIWLAGTVKQKGFSLLDREGIISLLNNNYHEK